MRVVTKGLLDIGKRSAGCLMYSLNNYYKLGE